MPDTSESDRERLLRLIDGRPEVVKEAREEQTPVIEEKKPAPPISPVSTAPPSAIPPIVASPDKKEAILDRVQKFLGRVHWDVAKLAKITLIFILSILALHSASDLVKSFRKPEKTSVSVPVTPHSVPADDSEAGLRLVGVDWGEPPVALLEDLKTGKTYFAHKNDKIKEARVKQIFKDKVVIVFRGKTVELR